MEKGGEQLPLSVSTILGGTIKKINKEVNSSSSFKVHVPSYYYVTVAEVEDATDKQKLSQALCDLIYFR